MSRDIGSKPSVSITKEEEAERKTEQGKLIFTSYKGHGCAMLLKDNRLHAAAFSREGFLSGLNTACRSGIGAVYIGKIKNVAKTINACFVEIADGQICFLSRQQASAPYLLNRASDGRLLEGDELLVQVDREAQKTKQASVTAQISLSNDYFVISMGSTKVKYSARLDKDVKNRINDLFSETDVFKDGCLTQDVSKLLSEADHRRMTGEGLLLERMMLPPTGCIVRTDAAEALPDTAVLLEQFFDLTAQYVRLLYTARYRSCFSCLREAPSAIETVLGQLASKDEYQEIVTDDEAIFTKLQLLDDSLRQNKKLRLYQDSLLSLSKLYSIESKLDMALERRIWLKSGGYLIIEPTEALTVIDVNSGKYEAKKGADETYFKINLEAAEEIALQLRLRNLSGIIVVDFINMRAEEERRALLNRLKELVKQDRVNTTIVDMTPLGLVEITRKKINKPLAEQWRDCVKNINSASQH